MFDSPSTPNDRLPLKNTYHIESLLLDQCLGRYCTCRPCTNHGDALGLDRHGSSSTILAYGMFGQRMPNRCKRPWRCHLKGGLWKRRRSSGSQGRTAMLISGARPPITVSTLQLRLLTQQARKRRLGRCENRFGSVFRACHRGRGRVFVLTKLRRLAGHDMDIGRRCHPPFIAPRQVSYHRVAGKGEARDGAFSRRRNGHSGFSPHKARTGKPRPPRYCVNSSTT